MKETWTPRHFEWPAFGFLAVLFGLGVLTLFSIAAGGSAGRMPLYLKQLTVGSVGLMLFFGVILVDYHRLARASVLLYAVTLALLVLVLFKGTSIHGARRWLTLGPLSAQPSELTKLALILIWAKILAGKARRGGIPIRELTLPVILMIPPVALMLKQPDLGTALSLPFILAVMVLVAGLSSRTLTLALVVAPLALPFAWQFFWMALKDYQRERLLTFMNPTVDPLGSGYHLAQSKIAIGSGGFFGKGLFGVTQGSLRFLPEGHTDFVFAVFAEAWGFVGVAVFIGVIVLLFRWGIEVVQKAKDPLGALMACGVLAFLAFQIAVNLAMAMGLMPVVGVPLPFVSYGGTALITAMIAFGLLVNIKMKRLMLLY